MNFTHDWTSNNFPIWETHLGHLASRPQLRMLEIGCFEGRATVWFLKNILIDSTSSITCIDTFEGAQEHQEIGMDFSGVEARFLKNISNWNRQVTVIKACSHEALRRLETSFDIIYIDGSHRTVDVLTDAVLSFLILKSNGILIFDDYEWSRYEDPHLNPRLGIDAFLYAFGPQLTILHKGYQVIAKRN